MKKLLIALMICAAAVPGIRAQNASEKDDKPTTELGKSMDDLSAAYKKLRRQVKDASHNESSLALLKSIRTAAEHAVTLTPALADDQPASKREAFVAAFHKKMHEFIANLEPLEAALKANNNTEAASIVAKLGDMQKKGHKEFKKPD